MLPSLGICAQWLRVWKTAHGVKWSANTTCCMIVSMTGSSFNVPLLGCMINTIPVEVVVPIYGTALQGTTGRPDICALLTKVKARGGATKSDGVHLRSGWLKKLLYIYCLQSSVSQCSEVFTVIVSIGMQELYASAFWGHTGIRYRHPLGTEGQLGVWMPQVLRFGAPSVGLVKICLTSASDIQWASRVGPGSHSSKK